MRNNYFRNSLISALLLLVSAAILIKHTRGKAAKLEKELYVVQKMLDSEKVRSKRIYILSDLNLRDSIYNYNLYKKGSYCFVDFEPDSPRNYINQNIEGPVFYSQRSNRNIDSLILNYFLIRDSIKLCYYCYNRHKQEFDHILDSIYKFR